MPLIMPRSRWKFDADGNDYRIKGFWQDLASTKCLTIDVATGETPVRPTDVRVEGLRI